MSHTSRKLRSGWRAPAVGALCALTATLLSLPPGSMAQAAQAAQADTAHTFPDWSKVTTDELPMARSWWPDAGAGASAAGLALVAKHITGMRQGGYGGMEINFLADRLTQIPASSTLPPAQQLGQPGVDQNTVQTGPGQCCVAYSNAQAKTLMFGSQNWQNVLTQIFKTGNSLGMHFDMAISEHWPYGYDNIDPNDPGQMQYATTAYSPITTADTASGIKQVPLPALRLWDQDNVPFIFVNHYAAATIMKVASVSATGTPTFSYASLTDASPQTTEMKNADGSPAGHAAGIMDSDWVSNNPSAFTGDLTGGSTTIANVSSTNGAQRQAGSLLSGPGIPAGTYIVSAGTNSIVMSNAATATTAGASIDARWNINTINADWGPVPTGDFQGKIDAAGDRRRMADWQYQYQTSVSPATLSSLGCTVPAPGAALAAGDCVLSGTYYQGTGQTRSGGVNDMQYNRDYVTSIYDTQGFQSFKQFWENNILGTWSDGVVTKPLGDTQLISLIRENARAHPEDALFEDSFEFSKPSGSGTYWTPDALSEMSSRLGYDASQYAPVLVGSVSFDTSAATGELSSTRVSEDFTANLGQDFTTKHLNPIQDWAKSTLSYNFKQQSYTAPGVQYANDTPVQEVSADNGAAEDGLNLAGQANLAGTNLVSAEALTGTTDYTTPWTTDVKGLNEDWASGINRVNFHGSPFNETVNQLPAETTINGVSSEWPGWEFQHGSANGYGAFDPRQIYWGDMPEVTNYIGRTQAVLQSGVAKVDLAVLEGTNSSYSVPSSSSYSLATLVNAGWSYNVIDDRQLTLPNAVVTGGVLDAHGPTNGINDGPAYKALIVSGATELKPSTVLKLIDYANAGLPVIFYNSTIARVYGTNQPGGDSTSATGNNDTALAADMAKLLAAKNVYNLVGATQADLLSQLSALRVIPNASYSASGLVLRQREIGGSEYYYLYNANTTGSNLTAAVTLGGSGQPYLLDAWTGKVTPIADYTSSDGTVTVNVSLAPQDATIIETGAEGGGAVHAISTSGGQVRYADGSGDLVLRATQPGSYAVSLSNGKTDTVDVASVPSAVDLSAGWSLKLDSYGPDPAADATDPEISAVTSITFPANALGNWASLPATSAQLSALGATSMSQVSGVGYYTNTFQLPAAWTAGTDGALLQLAHGNGDMVVAVTVNGNEISQVNQVTNTVDIGAYLKPGANTVQVKLDTNLGNRVGKTAQSYGLNGVTFTPYTQVTIP